MPDHALNSNCLKRGKEDEVFLSRRVRGCCSPRRDRASRRLFGPLLLSVPINLLQTPAYALLERELNYRAIATRTVATGVNEGRVRFRRVSNRSGSGSRSGSLVLKSLTRNRDEALGDLRPGVLTADEREPSSADPLARARVVEQMKNSLCERC